MQKRNLNTKFNLNIYFINNKKLKTFKHQNTRGIQKLSDQNKQLKEHSKIEAKSINYDDSITAEFYHNENVQKFIKVRK